MSKSITIQNIHINIRTSKRGDDFICLTDMARFQNPKEPKDVVKNWMRTIYTLDFMGIWERMNNPHFKGVEFDSFRKEAGTNSFTMSPEKWVAGVDAIGIKVKRGNNGGTYAHKDIAFEFATWLSPGFKLYLIKEFERLKVDEGRRLSIGWNLNRTLSKLNYHIHTDAIKEHIIPALVSKEQETFIYADEADVLNVALFGKTAKQWRDENKNKDGNIRDYASIEQLLVLANMESINAEFIRMGLVQKERLLKLNQAAIIQVKSLLKNDAMKKLVA